MRLEGNNKRRKKGRKKTLSSRLPRGVWHLIMIEHGVLSGALLTNTPRIDVGEAPL